MSLNLNDKQEKALRAWWSRRGAGDGKPSRIVYYTLGENPADKIKMIAEDAALVDAIAPLMKPWRVDGKGRHWVLTGPRGVNIIMDEQHDEYGEHVWATVVCDLLNESEGQR